MAFCPECRAEIGDDAAFCHRCGMLISARFSEGEPVRPSSIPGKEGIIDPFQVEPSPTPASGQMGTMSAGSQGQPTSSVPWDTPVNSEPTNRKHKALLITTIAIAATCLAAAIVFVFLFFVGKGGPYTASVKAQGTRVLSEPSMDGTVVAELPAGAQLLVIEEVDSKGRTYARVEATVSKDGTEKTVTGYTPVEGVQKKQGVAIVRVPDLSGLSKASAQRKVKAAGLRLSTSYPHDWRTNREVVTSQRPDAGRHAVKGGEVTVTLVDQEMAAAMTEAEKKIGEANAALADVQALGIDTSDLAVPIQSAQDKHDTARTVADLTGPTESSVYYADLVIQGSNAKKQAYLAQKAEEERRQKEAAEKARRQVIHFSQPG